VGMWISIMKNTMTPTAAFVLAAFWMALAIYATITTSNIAFIIGGAVLAIGFIAYGVRARRDTTKSPT